MGRPKSMPVRGPSRDRTLPGKQRIKWRRYLKWLEKSEAEKQELDYYYES